MADTRSGRSGAGAREQSGSGEPTGLEVEAVSSGIRIRVHVKPRASRLGVLGVRERSLEVAVTAPPVDGRANQAVIDVLADWLEAPRRFITLVSGQTSKTKRFELTGLAADRLNQRLASGEEIGGAGLRKGH